jgi:hypothetical protein
MRLTSALLALAMLAACAASRPDNPVLDRAGGETDARVEQTPAPTVPAARTFRPGIGVVESASVVSLSSAPSAAAGGTAGPGTNPTMAYRLKMEDGTTQDVVQAGERFELGDSVQITGDGRLARP